MGAKAAAAPRVAERMASFIVKLFQDGVLDYCKLI
jgi:hypothetical protein